jgi:thiol-disulfide isomerase/thioredoxin
MLIALMTIIAESGGGWGGMSDRPTVRPSDRPAPTRPAAQVGIQTGKPAPVVTINDLDGKPVNFGAFIGKKVVYLQFWATWCELCEALDPQVRAVRQKYGSEVEFLGVNVTVNQRLERVKRHLAEAPPPYRALWDDQGVAVRAYDVPSTSYVVIVDKQGKVAYTGVGKDQDLAGALRKVVGR